MDLHIEADLQKNTLIHIGFPKCASKTLQNLFTIHEALTYINNRYTFDLLISPHPFSWNGIRVRDGLSQLPRKARELGTLPVISDERLIVNLSFLHVPVVQQALVSALGAEETLH